jgi:DNA repair photolyase
MENMERQAKDGTFYKQVGKDTWEPVTRESKDGAVFKKVGVDQWSPLETETNKSEEPNNSGEAFNAKLVNSALLGYAPEIYAGGKQIYEDIKSVLPGGSSADKTVYDREIEKYRAHIANLEANHPVASFSGSLVGYAAPGGLIAKGLRSARGAVGLAPEAASLIGKSATLGTEGALMGAIERPSTNQDIVNIPERLNNALVGVAIGSAIPVGIEGVKKGFQAIPKIAKKATAILGGVSEDNISAFLKDPDRYMNAKPRDEVLATITGLVDDINTKVDDGKLSIKDAKEGLRWAGQQIKETASENHAIARDQLRQAEQRLRDKFVDSVNDLKAKPAPTQLQGQIDDTLRGMKEENIKASGESFDILQGEIGARQKLAGEKVRLKDLPSELKQRLDSFKNRFGTENEKTISKAIENAQDKKLGPYVQDDRIKQIGWVPNYAAEPTGQIGPKHIGQPNPNLKGSQPDPFMWADDKYKSTRFLVKKHIDKGIPLEINTSSDLIGKSDWIEALPKDSTVNMYMLTKDPELNRILFPGNPSRLRQEKAIQALKESGIKVNTIEPTAQSIADALGEKNLRSRIWKAQLGQKGEPITKKTMTFEIIDLLKSKIDDAENKSIRLVKEPAKESIEALEKKVIDEFEPPKTTINVRGVYSSLKSKAKELSQRNSADAKAAVKDLIKYMDDIKAKTADPDGNATWWLDAAEAKRIIQDLDSDVKSWDSSKIAGQFDDKYNQTMKQVRYKLDDKLKKEFPEYRKKMSEISERSKLLGEASKRFGKPELAHSRLSNIASDKAKFDRELLSKLGKYTGQDLDTPIADYVKTQKMLKDPKQLESLKRSLPEFDQLTDAQKLEKLAILDKSPKSFRSKLSKSPSFKELKMAQKDFDAALVNKDKIKGWTKSTSEGKLNAVMRGKTYVRGQLETLGKMSNQDLVKMVDDLKVSEAFDKEFRIGSRNVNLWGAMGIGALGGGPVGLIIGTVTGAMIDRYGPALTKKALIAVSKVQGSPSVQKLSKLGLPKNVAQDLTDAFYGSLIGTSIQENKKNTVIKNKGEAKWAQDGLRNIELFAQKDENLDILSQIRKLDQTDPEVKKLLIEASDFKPGTIGFQKVIDKLSQLKTKGE